MIVQLIIGTIIIFGGGFFLGKWVCEIGYENTLANLYDEIKIMEKNFWRVQEEAAEYKKARDEVFKQVTDLLEEKKKSNASPQSR